jgi:tetratricopeptide (TPR) repeat protein
MRTRQNKKGREFSVTDLQEKAEDHEREGEIKQAIRDYKMLVKINPLNEKAYNKILMLYRQLSDYENELKTVNAAIKSFEEVYRKKQGKPRKKIAQLSKTLQKITGLTDKKGDDVYRPAPIARWEKRKNTVIKRLKKKAVH